MGTVTAESLKGILEALHSDAVQNTQLAQRLKSYRGRGEDEAVKLARRIAGSIDLSHRLIDLTLDIFNDEKNQAMPAVQREARYRMIHTEVEMIADEIMHIARECEDWRWIACPRQ